jgi:glycosyltransferase involved in cell wall biosynthesis
LRLGAKNYYNEQMNDITIIVPVYNEEKGVEPFLKKLTGVLNPLNIPYEILFIDDGSTDGTLNILKQFRAHNKNIKIISLSRNFGQPVATFCGTLHAKGKCAVIMDADLQHPPEIIPEFIKKWREGFEVVMIKGRRKDYGIIRRMISSVYYKMYNFLSRDKTQTASSYFCLLDRNAIEAVKKYEGHSPYFKGLINWVGFKSCHIECDILKKRETGKSRWTFSKLLDFAIDAIVSNSQFPLRIWTYVGFIIATLSFIYALFTIACTLIEGITVPGWATTTVLILFFGGVQLMSIGIIGEYIGYILREVNKKPLYIIKENLTD